MDIAVWLQNACADAERRGLPELKPVLETLARSTHALRDADREFGHPAPAPVQAKADRAKRPELEDDDRDPS